MRGQIPWWPQQSCDLADEVLLLPKIIRGFDQDKDEDEDQDEDEEDDDSSESEDEDEDKGGEDSSKDEKSEKDDDSEDEDDDQEEDEAAGLKSALQKERKERKRLQKEMKALKKQVSSNSKEEKKDEKSEEKQQADERSTAAEERADKLAERLATQALDFELEKAARKAGFRDPEDVLKLVGRDNIDVEQDDDDPTDISVDPKDVDREVKALAKKKPHLVDSTGSGTKSGSKYGGGKKKTKKGSEQKLKDKYPALRT